MTAFLLLNGWAALVAFLFAVATQGTRRPGALLLSALCGYLVAVHSAVLLTGLVGYLTTTGVAFVLAGATAAAIWRVRRRRRERESGAHHQPRFTAAALFPTLAALVSGAVWIEPHLLQATRLWIWDDYTYHMVYPALWLREHAISAVIPAHAFTMQAWFPLSASVVAAWFMLPFQGARGEALAWVSLTGPLYAGIVACAVVEVLRRLGCRGGAWALALLPFATSPRIVTMASSFSDADLAPAAALFAGFVFAVPRGDAESLGDVRRDCWCAGLLTGIALGTKVTAGIPALIILAMLALRAGARSPAPRGRALAAAGTGLVFAVTWTATGGYWYARNLVRAGNPLYPARFLIWPGSTFPETTLLEYGQRYGVGKAVLDAVAVYMNWPPFHGSLAVVGLVGLAGWLVWRRRHLTRPQAYFVFGAVAITAAVVLLLPRAPFSAGNAMTFRSGFVHWDSMRYIALVPVLGWTALAFLLDAGAGASQWRLLTAVLVAAGCLLTSGDARLASPMLPVALALGAAVLARAAGRGDRWRPGAGHRAPIVAGALGILVAGLVLWQHDRKAMATAAAFYREPLFGTAVTVLDRQPRGTRVAVFGDQWIYPAFGAHDHLVPVRLDGDGRVATTPIGDAMTPGPLAVAPATLLENLRASGVDVVVVLHLPHPGRSPEFPAPHAALEASGARRLFRSPAVGIWAVGPARAREERPHRPTAGPLTGPNGRTIIAPWERATRPGSPSSTTP